jgi:acyl carrier protein
VNKVEILGKITEVVRDQLDDDGVQLSVQTVSSDIEGWDSLAHVRILIAVEQAFGMRLTTTQIASIESVGELIDIIFEAQGR